MFKTSLKVFAALTTANSVIYGLISFVMLSLNPFEWHDAARFVWAVLFAALLIVAIAILGDR